MDGYFVFLAVQEIMKRIFAFLVMVDLLQCPKTTLHLIEQIDVILYFDRHQQYNNRASKHLFSKMCRRVD